MERRNIEAVLTVPFFNGDNLENGLKIALEEAVDLPILGAVVVYDCKATSTTAANGVIEQMRSTFESRGMTLSTLAVDESDTTPRWLRGILAAFENPGVDAAFVFPADFKVSPDDETRSRWREMVEQSAKFALVLGDYAAGKATFEERFEGREGTFKGRFEAIGGWPALEVFFADQVEGVRDTGLTRLRTEFFIVCRAVIERARKKGLIWSFDPTTDLILSCVQNNTPTKVVRFAFQDSDEHRNPVGQLFQLTRYSAMLALNAIRLNSYIRLAPYPDSAMEGIQVYDALRDRIRLGFERLINSIDANRVELVGPPGDRYAMWTEKLANLQGLSPSELNKPLPGREKYTPDTLEPLPFEGISVIHNIEGADAAALGITRMLERLTREIQATEKLAEKIAFVDVTSVHVTTFDLLNEGEHSALLKKEGYDYQQVREAVERETMAWLRDSRLSLKATAEIVGVGMFAPKVLKLDLRYPPTVAAVFQTWRRALHAHLCKTVDGYSVIRRLDWDSPLTPHITVAYIVQPFNEPEITAFVEILRQFNDGFEPVSFELTEGVVTRFSDMDTYSPVAP